MRRRQRQDALRRVSRLSPPEPDGISAQRTPAEDQECFAESLRQSFGNRYSPELGLYAYGPFQPGLPQGVRRATQRNEAQVHRQLSRQRITVDFSLIPVKDQHGQVLFLLPEGRDITEKVEAEALIARKNRELQKLQATAEKARAVSDALLLNILPSPIAERLKARPGPASSRSHDIIADHFDEVSVLFADLVDFTRFSACMCPEQLVALLNDLFSTFDAITETHGLEKIKTIGDTYMAAAGLPIPIPDHAVRTAQMALDMLDALQDFNRRHEHLLQLRIGIHSGSVVAGVIGKRKFTYDLWGETVNTASRMESHGVVGRIQISDATRERLDDRFLLQERGLIDVKGMGQFHTWFLSGRRCV
ncbi:MAG: adenylate/guanylate cyclase domain-containing protein [Oceanospirillaceae bacterium]|nr:adenylate/guanylate cyclase domain-containing protein [Oceanospirillaceae bacterium]